MPVWSPEGVPLGSELGVFWLTVALIVAKMACASVSSGRIEAVSQMAGNWDLMSKTGWYE